VDSTKIGDHAPLPSRPQSFFSQNVLEHLFVQGQVGYQLLEPTVFILEYLQSSKLGNAHAGKLPLPPVESVLRYAHLAAHFTD